MVAETALFFETVEQIYVRVFRLLKPAVVIVPPITVQFLKYANANSRIRLRENRITVSISDVLEDAPAPVHEALAQILLGKLLGDAPLRKLIFTVIASIVSIPFLVLIFFVIYYVVPNGKVHPVQIFFASTATAVLWLVATFLFRLFLPLLDFKGSYQSLASIMALVTWIFISSFILILGANLSARDVLPKSWTRSA